MSQPVNWTLALNLPFYQFSHQVLLYAQQKVTWDMPSEVESSHKENLCFGSLRMSSDDYLAAFAWYFLSISDVILLTFVFSLCLRWHSHLHFLLRAFQPLLLLYNVPKSHNEGKNHFVFIFFNFERSYIIEYFYMAQQDNAMYTM